MDTQHAIDAQAKNLALRQLSTVAKGELDVVVDKMTEGARLAGATEQEIWDALTHSPTRPAQGGHTSNR
jgi:hypothetical protein